MVKIYLLIICLTLLLLLQSAISKKPLAPAIYCFGASVSDSGNNNYLPTLAKANFVPYGIDFINRRPTGRFTNGETIVDFLAGKLGLPFAPPYLGLRGVLKPSTGVNYASGACGILDETGSRLGECVPLSKQIDFFQATIEDLNNQFPVPNNLSEDYLAQSIFTFTAGLNDYINNYLQPDFYNSSRMYNPQQFAQLLVDRFAQLLKRLYEIGARKIVVFDLSAAGCTPAVLNAANSTGPCVQAVNQILVIYNEKLRTMLSNLSSELNGSKFILGATYSTTLDMNLNPSKYGFQAERSPCCAVGNVGTCIPGGTVCQDRSVRLYFDAIHWTKAVHSYFAANCFDQSPSICSPLTVKQLSQA